ncbi:MAG TPA: hypothetical protein VFF27_16100 [Bacteroidia bacterium]|nr:hypothetical protein [Bacteroidia bacterium]
MLVWLGISSASPLSSAMKANVKEIKQIDNLLLEDGQQLIKDLMEALGRI